MAGKPRTTHPVHRAATMIDSTIAAIGQHKHMVHPERTRADARRERIANAAPDIQAMRPHLTLAQLDALARLDEEK